MKTWLYAAASSRMDAERTFELARRHGVVWRSFYADRRPHTAIPNVRHLRPGDALYLGFRDGGSIRLLGKMRIGEARDPIQESPAFAAISDEVSATLVERYTRDPVLHRLVGIVVENVEAVDGRVEPIGRNAIREMELSEVHPATHPLPEEMPARRIPEPVTKTTPRSPSLLPNEGVTSLRRESTWLGIDVGGNPKKGYDLCALGWAGGLPRSVSFQRLPHQHPLPPTDALRPLVTAGDLDELAKLTHPAAAATATSLWNAVTDLAGASPAGVFIDAPSAFSRNAIGHGRFTEKFRLQEVSFQSTPSICKGSEHRGDWGWLVYGMVAFAAAHYRGGFSLSQWNQALRRGLYREASEGACVIREVFPTATVSHLRSAGRAQDLSGLLIGLAEEEEVAAVLAYLERGVRSVKRAGADLYDRADALVAALHSVAHMRDEFREREAWPEGARNWSADEPESEVAEGCVSLID